MNQNMNDPVNHPSHYCAGGIECIDAIAAALVCHTDPTAAWLTGQCLKYLWRWPLKNGVEDLRKTEFYLHRLIATVEKQGGGKEAEAGQTGESKEPEAVEPAEEETGRTLRDVVAERWPDYIGKQYLGGVHGCPQSYFRGYEECIHNCVKCWSRPMPMGKDDKLRDTPNL